MIYKNNVSREEAKWISAFLAPIRYSPKIEGQKVENGTIRIGPWAGPEATISNVLHEISHFVEIDEARMDKWGWGLKYPTQELFGRTFHEFSKPYHIEREMRVWAYQLNLHFKYGIKENAHDFAEAAMWLDGISFLIPSHKGKTDAQIQISVAKTIEKLAEETRFSFESFLTEFNRRKNLLTNKRK